MSDKQDTNDSDAIVLVGPCVIVDGQGKERSIESIEIAKSSFCNDIAINLKYSTEGEDDVELWGDKVFLKGVADKLREAGYVGPDIGRAELGAQGYAQIVLEPGDAFDRWAMTKGWTYGDGNDAWHAQQHLREIPWEAFMEFDLSDGRRFGVRLQPMISGHAEEAKPRHGDDMERALLDETLPLFRENAQEAAAWVLAELQKMEPNVRDGVLVEISKPAVKEVDVMAEFAEQVGQGDVQLNWGKKRAARLG